MMKVLVVFNPNAGHGHAGKLLPQVETALNDHGIEFDLLSTQYPGHGVEITRKLDVGKYRSNEQDYYYLNILGLGFVAYVTRIAHKLKILGNFPTHSVC